MVKSAARSRTREVAEALVDLAKDGTASLGLATLQFGDVQRLASADRLDRYIPGCFFKPEATNYEPFDASGTEFQVQDIYRICYAFDISGTEVFTLDKASDDLSKVLDALAQNLHISTAFNNSIRPDQVVLSQPLDTDWKPEEDEFFEERSIPIKVVVTRWEVKWLARRSS